MKCTGASAIPIRFFYISAMDELGLCTNGSKKDPFEPSRRLEFLVPSITTHIINLIILPLPAIDQEHSFIDQLTDISTCTIAYEHPTP